MSVIHCKPRKNFGGQIFNFWKIYLENKLSVVISKNQSVNQKWAILEKKTRKSGWGTVWGCVFLKKDLKFLGLPLYLLSRFRENKLTLEVLQNCLTPILV